MSHDPTEQRVADALRASAPVDTDVEGGLAALRDRIENGNDTPLAIGEPHRPRRRLALVAAAALLLVAAAAVAVAVAIRSGDDQVRVANHPAEPGTGWYLPVGLDEWQVESVGTDFRDAEGIDSGCPCESWTWADPDAQRSAYVRRAQASGAPAFPEGDSADVETVDLGDEVSGMYVTTPFGPYLTFQQGTSNWFITGFDLPKTDVLDMGRRVAAGRGPNPPNASFGLIESYQTRGGIAAYQDVHVVMRNEESGVRAAYMISPSGRGSDLGSAQSMPATMDLGDVLGQGLSVDDADVAYVFRLPDADITSDSDSGFGINGRATATDIQTVLRALRPATAAEWAAFVGSATDDRGGKDAIAPTIDDLSKPIGSPPTTEPN